MKDGTNKFEPKGNPLASIPVSLCQDSENWVRGLWRLRKGRKSGRQIKFQKYF